MVALPLERPLRKGWRALASYYRELEEAAGVTRARKPRREALGRARDGAEAVEQIQRLRPDVALVDLRIPGLSGIEVAQRVTRTSTATAIIIYTEVSNRALLRGGARRRRARLRPQGGTPRRPGLPWTSSRREVPPSIPCSPDSVRTRRRTRARHTTQRERDVLRLPAEGLSNEQVGCRLFISAETVCTHLRKAMSKLHAGTRTHAVAEALRQSLIA